MAKDKVELYMANQSAATIVDGEEVWVKEGDLVRAGHEILKGREWLFEPAEGFVRFDTEQATNAPGEKRGRRKGGAMNEAEDETTTEPAPEPEPEPEGDDGEEDASA